MKRFVGHILIWALVALLSVASAKAATFVQSAQGSTFSGTTVTASLTGVVTGHSIRIMAALSPETLTISSIVDGANTYSVLSPAATQAPWVTKLAYSAGVTGGSLTVTLTTSGAMTAGFLLIEEWSGDATSATIDGTNGQYVPDGTAGTTLDSGNITMTNTNDDIWAAVWLPNGIDASVGPGFTAATQSITFWTEHKASTGSGTVDPSFLSGSGSFDNYVMSAAFAQTGGGGPSCSRNLMTMGAGC